MHRKVRRRKTGYKGCGNQYQEVAYYGSQENRNDYKEQFSS